MTPNQRAFFERKRRASHEYTTTLTIEAMRQIGPAGPKAIARRSGLCVAVTQKRLNEMTNDGRAQRGAVRLPNNRVAVGYALDGVPFADTDASASIRARAEKAILSVFRRVWSLPTSALLMRLGWTWKTLDKYALPMIERGALKRRREGSPEWVWTIGKVAK